ncbi:MATE family efflux transporter [Planktotalea sp.]|uniref:MATE family efflux transporter n=1 Tax=Planktotalea sp. TaxID=2029877 RepID=UPI0025CFFB35|nr:MATE family efflux transporter [Planktotalea sp.]
MAAPRDYDLTTGSIASHFKTIAIPAAFGMLFTTLYNVVDVFYAGQLGTDAQAGLAIGFQAFFVLLSFAFGLSAAMSALVGNARGAKDNRTAHRLAVQGLAFAFIATAILMVFAIWFGPRAIALISEPGEYRDAATGYFYWLIAALPGFILTFSANGILQAHGDSVTLQRSQVIAFLANIALNPLFIYGIPGVIDGMGFNGIAFSTILCQTGVMIWILWTVSRLEIMKGVEPRHVRIEAATVKEILAQMLPVTTAMMVMFISGFVVQYALKGFGEEAIAAYGIALRIEQILLLPVLGMTGALLPIAAQNYGAGNHERVREATWFCWKLGFAMTAIAAPILWFGGGLAMSFFTDDARVIPIGQSYLRVDGFLFPLYMMLFAINSLLQALKKPVYTLWISLYRQGFGVAFFIWLLIGVMGLDVWGVWLAIAAAVSSGWVIALILTIRIANDKIGGLRR